MIELLTYLPGIFMEYYATPTGNETAGMYELFKFINNSSNGIFWISMIFVVWVIAFMALKNYSTSRAWTFASFFCSVLAILAGVMDYISPRWMYLFIVFTLIGFVWLKLEG